MSSSHPLVEKRDLPPSFKRFIQLSPGCAATIATTPATGALSFDSSADVSTIVAGGVNAVVWDAGGGNGRLAITTGPGYTSATCCFDNFMLTAARSWNLPPPSLRKNAPVPGPECTVPQPRGLPRSSAAGS